MKLNDAVPFVATVLMFAFAAIVLQKFVQRRHLHNLFWGVGLAMFGIGTFAEAYLAIAWSDALFRAWYVFGAMLNAGWLGHGSLILLARRPWLRFVTAALVVLSAVGIIATFTIPINSAAFTTTMAVGEQYKAILPPGAPVRLLTPIFNIYGTIFLVGGAFYSAYLYRRKQMAAHRVAGNILIAVGALVIAAAGTLTRLFFGGLLSISELIAAVLMFGGFMIASAPAAALAPAASEAQRPV